MKRMVDTDDTSVSGVDFLTSCLLARMGAYQHPVDEITRFVNRSLENMSTAASSTRRKSILSASWAGLLRQRKELGEHSIGASFRRGRHASPVDDPLRG
jgi:hypothetical protein